MAIIGFIVCVLVLAWATLFALGMTLGTFFITGEVRAESIAGAFLLVVLSFGWHKLLFDMSPFVVTILS